MDTDERAKLLAERDEARAIVARIKEHIGLWTLDKRLRIAGEIILRDIQRFEAEEAERTERGERRPRT